ncbi:MAG TPA: SPFH domain-containing protein [Gemmataceae bacterium]|jgi:membrane protease subunit HflK|nr:SPFH domain-containing protein [Gemmataceae bacterium]
MKRLRYLPLIAIAIYLLTGVAQIRPEERAVVRRFGKVVAHPGPGLWIGFPYGIDRLDRVPTATVRRVPVGYRPEMIDDGLTGQFLTGDQNLVNVQVAIDYAVGEGATDLEDYVAQKDRIDGVLARETEAALGEWVSGRPVDDVLLTGNVALPGWLVRRVQERIADQHLGVRVQQASVAYLAPPDEVRGSFEEVNRAQTAARSQEQRAQQEATRMRQDAASTGYQLEQQAIGVAASKKAMAHAEADTFKKRLEQYRKTRATNPDALAAIWWEEMGRVWFGFKGRGRIELLDPLLGPDGLDLTQVVPPPKR